MSRLWDRGGPLDDLVLRLTVGRDPELDLALVPYDCLASAAHASMLESIGVLTKEELAGLRRELGQIAAEARAGEFAIDPADEDGHTAIENRLSGRLGEAGRKIHTGRSRNDQVIAALRLWGRERVLDQAAGALAVVQSLCSLAGAHRETTVPGYTHARQAMPTTLGHFFAAWADNLLDDLPWLQAAFRHLDRSPLGSASGFGVGLPLDRQMVSDDLRFERPQVNTLAVQNDRGKSEYLVTGAAAAVATDLGRLASDLIWYSSDELRYLLLPGALTTGSSMMPQKRNPDVLELVRAGAATLRSRHAEIGALYGSLPAGYHRDLQLTKEPFLAAMTALVDMMAATRAVLDGLEVDVQRCRAAVLAGTCLTDAIYGEVEKGVPFRDAYRGAAEGVGYDPEVWRRRTHLGAPGDTSLELLTARHETAQEWVDERRAALQAEPL